MYKFGDFSLHPSLLENLAELGHNVPTLIQEKTIPLILKGHDLLGIAQTGTGKTGAFSLPVIQNLILNPPSGKMNSPRALVVAPTRELALQINEAIGSYIKGLDLKSCAIYGGVDQLEQVRALRSGVDIVIATPGRLLDLAEQRLLKLTGIKYLVLDEADRMLDMGFIDDVEEIIKRLPSDRQTMLFSATMPRAIENLAKKVLKNPETVEINPHLTTAKNIQQKVIYCRRDHKFQLLKKIIKENEVGLVLVFTRTKNLADNVVEYLAQNRKASRAIHGDKSQEERERALDNFKTGAIKILVATDVASRGIDIDGITHVINFDLPLEPESYVHRIGRTARAGKSGFAISFCDDSEKPLLEKIQQTIQMYLIAEKFEGKTEPLKFKGPLKTAPTPGKSQEKNAWLDHSKRQPKLKEGEKRVHPGFRNSKKKRK